MTEHPQNLLDPTRFESTGVAVLRQFLSAEAVVAINAELDRLLSMPSVNGTMGRIEMFPGYIELMMPTLTLTSVNLLEVAVEIRDAVRKYSPKSAADDLVLTNVEVFSEQLNPRQLPWHTDQRQGMIRGQIYLAGGGEDSGAFEYMAGSSDDAIRLGIKHHLSSEQVNTFASKIVTCAGAPGDLVLFDALGFHSKKPTLHERRTIMFELQPREGEASLYGRSRAFLSSANLSPKVLKNIDMLTFEVREGNHGMDQFLVDPRPPFPGSAARTLLWSLRKRGFAFFKTLVRTALVRLSMRK